MSRYLIDASDLGRNQKGISRVLKSLVPRLVERSEDELVVACASEAADALTLPDTQLVAVPVGLNSKWEQWDLPRLATKLRADAVYSHREAGALWGPPLVLHLPEDPEVRWERERVSSVRELARRGYSRALLRHSLRRSAIVAASTPSAARGICARYGIDNALMRVLPLGVDLELFRPAANSRGEFAFHLASSDPRDLTPMVLEAWSLANRTRPVPRLVVGGDLGAVEDHVLSRAAALEVDIELTGRLSDVELADRLAHAAVVVQPSSDEGFGLQPLEAMAAGAPVVVTKAPSVIDVVGDAAVVCDSSSAAVADGILRALASATDLGRRARGRAERFSWDASADAVLDALVAAAKSGNG